MAAVVPVTAFEAYQKQIKALCLQEFPCGIGSWREHLKPESYEERRSEFLLLEAVEADREESEALLELITYPRSPWYLDYSWSKEAKSLRETAIKSPWLINPDFVHHYIRTLNIVDKGVTEVDNGLVRLKNLEELTLSANYITNINSKCLPCSLKVLELCANNIADISDLCIKPPPLHHLGLSRNRISFVGDYISGTYWKNLMSLDLSHNDLCGLIDIVKPLLSLPWLRNLILQGNPISLIPGYRGYIIDCLHDLSVLDDKHISIDEKRNFQGLAIKKELILDEAIVELGVTRIRGLQCPAEVMYPETQTDYPVIERAYFVQFMFPKEFHETAEEADIQTLHNLSKKESTLAAAPLTEMEENELDKHVQMPASSNQSFEVHTLLERISVAEISSPKEQVESLADVPQKVQTPEVEDRKIEEAEMTTHINLVPVNSHPHPWEDELHLNWTTDLTQKDLLVLRDFFKAGMDVNIVEQIVEAYPAGIDVSSGKNIDSTVKDPKEKRKSKTKKKEQKKESKPARKESEKGKEKGKKKKELLEVLVRSPPTFTNIASFHVPLDSFINGEYEYKNTFIKGNVPSQIMVDYKISEDKTLDKLKEKRTASAKQSPDKKKDTKKSPRGKDVENKSSKGKQHADAEHESLAPLSLELELSVKLHHWLTAMDYVKKTAQSSTNEIKESQSR